MMFSSPVVSEELLLPYLKNLPVNAIFILPHDFHRPTVAKFPLLLFFVLSVFI